MQWNGGLGNSILRNGYSLCFLVTNETDYSTTLRKNPYRYDLYQRSSNFWVRLWNFDVCLFSHLT